MCLCVPFYLYKSMKICSCGCVFESMWMWHVYVNIPQNVGSCQVVKGEEGKRKIEKTWAFASFSSLCEWFRWIRFILLASSSSLSSPSSWWWLYVALYFFLLKHILRTYYIRLGKRYILYSYSTTDMFVGGKMVGGSADNIFHYKFDVHRSNHINWSWKAKKKSTNKTVFCEL